MLVGVAIRIHNPKIVLSMLIQILRGNSVAARDRFTRQCHVSLENLIGVPANFDIRTIAFESLNSVRHPLSVMVRIVPIIATA